MPESAVERNPLIRGKLYKFLNLGLCLAGIIFVIIGIFKSTLLLYIGCAFVGAAVGGFIRSRLPLNAMVPSTGVHLVYRSEVRSNAPVYNTALQTYVIMHSQQPCGIGQKKINQFTSIIKYLPSSTALNVDSFDTVSAISAITDKVEPSENCCIVCLIKFKNGQEVRALPCQHIFHINCIDKWLKINRLCPTCRSDVTLPAKAKEAVRSNMQSQGCITPDNGSSCSDQCYQDSIVPCRSAFVDMTTITDNEVREDQVGNDADITQELASSSRDVVVHVASDTVTRF